MKNEIYLNYDQPDICIKCRIVRSGRKSVSIQITPERDVVIRAPETLSCSELKKLVEQKKDWILNTLRSIPEKPDLTVPQQKQLAAAEKHYRKAAQEYIPGRVLYFQKQIGVIPARITIRDQKTRWGSCSSNRTLSFNYRLMLAPPEILDYVVVHELCHLKHMNHSSDFWSEVGKVLPDYRKKKEWLKNHGQELTMFHHLFSQEQK